MIRQQLLLFFNKLTRILLSQVIYLNVHPLEVVSRYRDPQLQVDENYAYLFKYTFYSRYQWFELQIRPKKMNCMFLVTDFLEIG